MRFAVGIGNEKLSGIEEDKSGITHQSELMWKNFRIIGLNWTWLRSALIDKNFQFSETCKTLEFHFYWLTKQLIKLLERDGLAVQIIFWIISNFKNKSLEFPWKKFCSAFLSHFVSKDRFLCFLWFPLGKNFMGGYAKTFKFDRLEAHLRLVRQA